MYISPAIIGRALVEIAPTVDKTIIEKVMEVYALSRQIDNLQNRLLFLTESANSAEKMEEWELIVFIIHYACDVGFVDIKRAALHPRIIVPGPNVTESDTRKLEIEDGEPLLPTRHSIIKREVKDDAEES